MSSEQERTIAMLTRCMQQSRDGREYNSLTDESCAHMETQQSLPPEPMGNGEDFVSGNLAEEVQLFNPPLATPTIWFGFTWPPMGP